MTERDELIRQYEDLRYNLSLRAFTAPDAPDEEMLESLDARIRDVVSANGTPPSGDVVEQARTVIANLLTTEPGAVAAALGDAGLLRTELQQDIADPNRGWPCRTTVRHGLRFQMSRFTPWAENPWDQVRVTYTDLDLCSDCAKDVFLYSQGREER